LQCSGYRHNLGPRTKIGQESRPRSADVKGSLKRSGHIDQCGQTDVANARRSPPGLALSEIMSIEDAERCQRCETGR
jgi:hypothetical protein